MRRLPLAGPVILMAVILLGSVASLSLFGSVLAGALIVLANVVASRALARQK